LKPGIGRVAAKRASRCMAGLTSALVGVAAAGQLVHE